MKDWAYCPHFSTSYDGPGLCDLVPESDWGLCYYDLDDCEELCPQPSDIPDRPLPPKSFDELAAEQGIHPLEDWSSLTGHWPEGADFDSFLEATRSCPPE